MERVREQASMRKKVRDHSLKSTWELQLKQARKKIIPDFELYSWEPSIKIVRQATYGSKVWQVN